MKPTAEDLYRQEMGKDPPVLPADDPLAHQWSYGGTREERERLAQELGQRPEQPAFIEGQESLL